MIDRVKDALILVPGFHLATCFVYLFFYYASFGQGLVYFSDPTDIFSVSLADVAPAYVWLLIGVFTSHALFRHPKMGNVFHFDTLTEEQKLEKLPYYRRMNSFLWWGLIILWAQTTVTALLAFMATGFLPRLFASLSAQFGVILLSLWALKRFDLKKLHYDLLSVASLILVSLAVSGFGDAQNDKHLRFTDLPSPWIGCRDLQIRRRFSDFSLAIARDNSRVLVNDNCEVKYTVTSAKRFTPLPEGAPADQIMTLF